MMVFDRDDVTFTVVINHEEQYSIWPTFKPIPNGWNAVGKTGTRKECLDHIEQVWTDMRPLTLRKFMDEAASVQKPA
jgi:MbtH protein